MIAGLDKWQAGFFLGAAFLLVFEMISGWRRGLVRQLFTMATIVTGYLAGLYGGRLAVPIFRPLGYPDFVTLAAGSLFIALTIMIVLSLVGAIVFKKTSQQSLGIVRFFYGLSGAFLGAGIGLFFIWIALLGARLLGTVAESEIRPHATPLSGKAGAPDSRQPPKALVSGLAGLKHSLDQSPIGPLVEKVDPIPVNVYSTLGKVVRMVSSTDAMDRLLKFPGSKPIAAHPAVVALTKDPEIVEAIRNGNYLSLIKNRHLVEAANNPEIIDLVKRFDLQKALDYALAPDPKKPVPANP